MVLTPWNDPLAVAAGLIGAALAVGNTVVHKPSERCPSTGRRFAEIVAEHFPPGVLEIVDGDGAVGAALAAAPVDVVAHVGSTTTGRHIAAACARTGARALLENGGNDPLVIDEGVDPEWAAAQAALGSFANAGQICVSVERIYLHSTLTEPFLAALTREAHQGERRSARSSTGHTGRTCTTTSPTPCPRGAGSSPVVWPRRSRGVLPADRAHRVHARDGA